MKKNLLYILIAGLITRILFYLYGAELYFGTERFTIQGDTYSWVDSILNLIHHGSYSVNLDTPNGYFYRPPGYAFFIGLFYILTGYDLPLSLKIIPWVQILIDVCSIYLIFSITYTLFQQTRTALLASFFYAFYPFIIVWNPVIYAESISIFLLQLALHFYFKGSLKALLLAGIVLGIAALTRLQIIFIFPLLCIGIWMNHRQDKKIKTLTLFIVAFSFIYGLWPARNIIFHNRILLAQDLNIGKNWSPDYLSFMNYIFSVQTDHKPQFDQIVNDTPVEWPAAAYHYPEDRLLLEETTILCKSCGTGFSHFINFRHPEFPVVTSDKNCDLRIAANFNRLISSQKKHNTLHYYVKVPLMNLNKALFKFTIYGDKSTLVRTVTILLFLGRTLFILLGIAGLIILFKSKKHQTFALITSGFFILWYIYLCFVYRNIEIRYLLPVDILLLIPAAYFIDSNYKKKNIQGQTTKIY